ncbi:MAG: hypothetical protein GWO41_04030, partial [candidate division Zixibacteria bacterium]|nr:hypothetical protein [candidate division Zixibacteria bacterium]NIU14091.1 hypothetical protein [candidate division Zixibacteria bacterium]NIX79035.1 hypothetical protein [candidate division Zixibacteria bacterium]
MAKLKKKSKRSTKKKKVVRKLTGSPHILMLQKIFNIQCSMPVIDCDRTGEDDEGR